MNARDELIRQQELTGESVVRTSHALSFVRKIYGSVAADLVTRASSIHRASREYGQPPYDIITMSPLERRRVACKTSTQTLPHNLDVHKHRTTYYIPSISLLSRVATTRFFHVDVYYYKAKYAHCVSFTCQW